MCPECPTKKWWGKSCWLHPRESDPDVVQGPGGVITSPTLLGSVLVLSQQKYLKLLLAHEISRVLLGLLPRDPPRGKVGRKMNDKKYSRGSIHDNAQIKPSSTSSQLIDCVFMATKAACLPQNAFSNCLLCTTW